MPYSGKPDDQRRARERMRKMREARRSARAKNTAQAKAEHPLTIGCSITKEQGWHSVPYNVPPDVIRIRDGSNVGLADTCRTIAPSETDIECCQKAKVWTCEEGHRRPLTFYGQRAYEIHREIEHG